jgi:membrane protease YdiL (CAAX protease family)
MSNTRFFGRQLPRAELLVTLSVLVLIGFYYFTRADTIGVFSTGRGWSPLTMHPFSAVGHFAAAAVLLGVVPALVASKLMGLSFKELGFGLGHWRRGIVILAIGVPLAIVAGKVGSTSPVMRSVYPLDPDLTTAGFPFYALMAFLYFGSWEMLFRGVLLFGLKECLGDSSANVLQTALSVTAHFGRALNETLAALPAGLIFGCTSLRVGSIWYIAIIHWAVGLSMEYFIIS